MRKHDRFEWSVKSWELECISHRNGRRCINLRDCQDIESIRKDRSSTELQRLRVGRTSLGLSDAVLTRRIKGCEFNPPYFTGIYVGIGTKRVLRRKRDTPRTEENWMPLRQARIALLDIHKWRHFIALKGACLRLRLAFTLNISYRFVGNNKCYYMRQQQV